MMKIKNIFFSLTIGTLVIGSVAQACTAILVTRGASRDHSVMVSHSDDDELNDQRIVVVPAMDHAPGSQRPVYAMVDAFPRYVGDARGPAYRLKGYAATKPLGSIPQVAHTYRYIEGNYPIANEKQLSFGESTAAAVKDILLKSHPKPGKRIFNIDSLMRVAAERCDNARCAVKLMGDLAVKYGFYNPDGGEAVLVGDKHEGWLFEVTSSPDGKSALWVAQKIPDGQITVVANEFRIRELTPETLHSPHLLDIAKQYHLWNPKEGAFDWLKAVSEGEYGHPYYSLRRVWRIYSLVNPSLHLSPWVTDGYTKAYPVSIRPAHPLSVAEVMRLYRDHYEGTSFDMTQGLAAGPFGSPERYFGPYDKLEPFAHRKLEGAWERPISAYYAGYTTIVESRAELPDAIGGRIWLGLDRPYSTVFMPFYVGIKNMPETIANISPEHFDRTRTWWAFNFVSNWATLKFSYMKKDIQTLQQSLESKEFLVVKDIERHAASLKGEKRTAYLTDFCTANVVKITKAWWELADRLIVKYNDGYIDRHDVGYPAAWRDAVGYRKGPIHYQRKMPL